MRGGCDDVGEVHRIGVRARGHESGEVSHIHHEEGADLVGDFAKGGEVDGSRVGRVAGDDDIRFFGSSQILDHFII